MYKSRRPSVLSVLFVLILPGCIGTSDKIIENGRRSDIEFRDQQRTVKMVQEQVRDVSTAASVDRAYVEAKAATAQEPRPQWPTEYADDETIPTQYLKPEPMIAVFSRLHKAIGAANRDADVGADTREYREEDHGNWKVEEAQAVVMAVGDLPWWMQLIVQFVRPVQTIIADFKWQAQQRDAAKPAESAKANVQVRATGR